MEDKIIALLLVVNTVLLFKILCRVEHPTQTQDDALINEISEKVEKITNQVKRIVD